MRSATQAVKNPALAGMMDVGLVVSASLFVALCAKVSVPLPFTPVPLTLSNFAVLLVGMLLGPWRGGAALALYVAEGVAGLPVYSAGPGGIVQLLGPSGGYLMAYPAGAWLAGMISAHWKKVVGFVVASVSAELLLFAAGVAWLMAVWHANFRDAFAFGAVPFVFAEVIKVTLAAGIANRWQRLRRN